tara:strand:+ start:34530 stop:35366 length:837 start_codon:yes stop_codon:yes gene_type:complete
MNTPRDPSPVELAQALEERGFESLWFGEHSHIPVSRQTPYPGGGEMPEPYKMMRDPYISLMAAASVTTRLRLGTGIALLMERDIFSQAKTISTLDQLSGGRVLIGTGVGWNEEEFANVSRLPWNKRYGVMRETIAATRALWRDEEAEYHGEYIDFDPVWSLPSPMQQPGPPILFGAMGTLGMKHAAQWADGWMPVDVGLGGIGKSVDAFRAQVKEAGRDPDTVPVSLQTLITPSLDQLLEYRDLGIARVIVGVAADSWEKTGHILPMLDEFAGLIARL